MRLAITILTLLLPAIAAAGPEQRMLDPATDDPQREWCYLAKSTTVIGVPFQPDVTQITFDGAVFTRQAELCFFHGERDQPLLARSKTFLDGWLPIVQYDWREGDVAYDIEYFSAPLAGENADNTVNFIQLRMHNAGNRPAKGTLTAALRQTGGDYRNGGSPFSPVWRYEMTEAAALRDGKVVYTFSPGAGREAVPGVACEKPFAGKEHFITARAECCLARYHRELQPGESFAAVFKMPRVPVPVANADFLEKLHRADYPTYRANIIAYWTQLLRNTPVLEVPEKRFQDAYRASLVHLLLATRGNNGQRRQTDGLPYPDFFLTSVPEMAMMYLVSGLPEFSADMLVPGAIAQQQPSGLYFDRAVAHGRIIPATQGHILYSIAMTVLFTRDQALAERVYPSLQKAVGFIRESIAANPHGLLPRCHPYDAEMIDGHYTGQNLFALMGLRCTVRVARLLGKTDDAAAWTQLAERYEANILKAIEASAKPDGYIPPGLYPYLTGPAARGGFAEYQTHCDWENMILAYPTEALAPADARVKGTLDRVRRGYAEGIMTYRHGMHLHQYITSNMIEQYLARGDGYTALKDFYHQLLHGGSTHESFENLVSPWTDRVVDAGCPPPHAWGTSKQGLMVRNFLLMEYGGKCGMEPGRRELWLFHCLSPEWVKPGRRVSIRNAPTEFGKVSATMVFGEEGAELTLAGAFHEQPAAVRVRVPYFKELLRHETDAKQCRREGDCLLLSPDATNLTLQWRDKPGAHLRTVEDLLTDYRSANRFKGADNQGRAIVEPGKPFLAESEKGGQPRPLSFALVRETFQHEYRRLAEECVKNGGTLLTVAAPAMLPAAERRERFAREHGLLVSNPATGCAVEASASLPGHGAELAVDGVVTLQSSWQADPYPQWLKLDLGKPVKLKGIHVWTYWGLDRYYQYTVETSTDGKVWTKAADMSGNKTPATPQGVLHPFEPRSARYVRIHMLHHSLNAGVHVVEVAAMPAP